jgi:hypothetical protein
MEEQEKKDLEELKKKQIDIKIKTFDYLKVISHFNDTDLKHSGYSGKTIAQAMESVMTRAIKELDKLVSEYIKKYPDE